MLNELNIIIISFEQGLQRDFFKQWKWFVVNEL
jgi:hypothetical protein